MTLFRADLLRGRKIVLAGRPAGELIRVLAGLGASLCSPPDDVRLDDGVAQEWFAEQTPIAALIVDTAASFGAGGPEGLKALIDEVWTYVRAAGAGALIPGSGGGKVVLIAPPPGAGPLAGAAGAALENLARTLSVEWARHAVTVVAVAPGDDVSEPELAAVVAFLASGAGDYFSGCRLELGAARASFLRGA
jgi:NAD(P)-dependent dehydrogenase (short-subunit alcohol dehydrogenase family)